LLGGWAVAGVTTIQSGAPLSLTGTNSTNIFGITTDRAQLAAGCTYADLTTSGTVHDKLSNYFNKSCVLRNAAGTAIWPVIGDDARATAFGNSGVGIVFGPDQRNFDIVLIKRTALKALREAANLEFRTEFFNAFNQVRFDPPQMDTSSAFFGQIQSAQAPRILQVGLRFQF
jgi:hypothetical protein